MLIRCYRNQFKKLLCDFEFEFIFYHNTYYYLEGSKEKISKTFKTENWFPFMEVKLEHLKDFKKSLKGCDDLVLKERVRNKIEEMNNGI